MLGGITETDTSGEIKKSVGHFKILFFFLNIMLLHHIFINRISTLKHLLSFQKLHKFAHSRLLAWVGIEDIPNDSSMDSHVDI